MRQRRYKAYELQTGCGVEVCLEVVGGKWKGILLHHLMEHGTVRFSELQRLKPSLSPRILTAQLRELEADGVIQRKVYAVVPPRVEYSLTAAGESLRALFDAMRGWGDDYTVRNALPLKSGSGSHEQSKPNATPEQRL